LFLISTPVAELGFVVADGCARFLMTVSSVRSFLRNCSKGALLALLVIGTAAGATPSGQITADPQVVIVPAGASAGNQAKGPGPAMMKDHLMGFPATRDVLRAREL
jgi:hypothetical protein